MTTEMIIPHWMREQITAEQYDSWSEEQCAGIEIVDGMVRVTPAASVVHNRAARLLANALDAAGGDAWNADYEMDLRLQDVPLLNRCPDVTVYRADKIRSAPMRPESVLLVVEVVSPGSETTDRMVKPIEYARAGIRYYWRVEGMAADQPVIHTYVLNDGSSSYRATEVFDGLVKVSEPFPVEVDLREI